MSRIRYFTPREITLHNTPGDLWISLFDKVLDLSPICKGLDEGNEELFALLLFAGKDISHMFDEHGEVKLHVDPNTNRIDAFLPFKRFLGAPSQEEAEKLFKERKERDAKLTEAFMQKYRIQKLGLENDSSTALAREWEKEPQMNRETLPWWKDDQYVVGFLTRKPRWIKILNTMIMKEDKIEVCSEETIQDILERYLKFNRHVRSYTWKYLGEVLEMNQTLESNGIPDQDEEVYRLRLNSDDFIPTLNLYFNHDLTEM